MLCSEMCTITRYTKHRKIGKFCDSQLPDPVLLNHPTDQQLRDSAPNSRVSVTFWRVSSRLRILHWPGGRVRIFMCTMSGEGVKPVTTKPLRQFLKMAKGCFANKSKLTPVACNRCKGNDDNCTCVYLLTFVTYSGMLVTLIVSKGCSLGGDWRV